MKKIKSHYFKSFEERRDLHLVSKEEFKTLLKEKVELNKTSLVSEHIEDEDQIKLKMTAFLLAKRIDSTFFKKELKSIVLIFKKKNGIFYYGNYTKPHRKKKVIGTIRTFPIHIKPEFFLTLRGMNKMIQISDFKNCLISEDYYESAYRQISEFQNKVLDYVGFEDKNIDLMQFSYVLRMKSSNIKIPNNWKSFTIFTFTKKDAKKNNSNLVDIFLYRNEKFNLYSKKYKKFLNTTNLKPHQLNYVRTNLEMLRALVGDRLFKDYDLQDLSQDKLHLHSSFDFYTYKKRFVNERDQLNIHNFIKACLKENPTLINTLNDHGKYLTELHEKLGRSPRFNFTSISKYNSDHYEMAKTIMILNTGNIVRTYDKYFTKAIEKDFMDYKIHLLKETGDYVEESEFQRNCVKTYTQHKDNFIVSIRDGKTRVTIEYQNSKNKPLRSQTFGFANSNVDMEIWGDVINELDKRVFDYFNYVDDFEFDMTKNTIVNEFHKYISNEKISWKNLEVRENIYNFGEEIFNYQII